MADYTPQQLADELNSLHARALSIVEGTISGAANPGGSVTFTYRLSDGQTATATGTAWNACSPSKVSALKMADDQWIVVGRHEAARVRSSIHVDRRARPVEKKGGNIKVLFSVIEGEDRVFYLWGDRAVPKRIGVIPATGGKIDDVEWTISNRGKGDRFIANVKWREPGFYDPEGFYNAPTHTQAFGDQSWEYINQPERLGFVYNDIYLGHGFWSSTKYFDYSYVYAFTPVVIFHPTSYSLYKGVPTSYAGNLSVTSIAPNGDGEFIDTQTIDVDVAISPTQTRHNHSFGTRAGVEIATFFVPIAISKDEAFAFYEQQPPVGSQTIKLFLASNSFEVELGGDVPLNAVYYNRAGNLISNQYFEVKPPSDSLQSQWEVDVYTLGENTTKSTIKTKVTYKQTPDKTFHSASYHP